MGKSSTTTLYVGMDLHKDGIDIAVAEAGLEGEVRHFGSIGGDLAALDEALRKLVSRGAPLHTVYEAAPAPRSFGAACTRRACTARDQRIATHAEDNPAVEKPATLMGIDPVGASASLATVGDFKQFKNGAQLAVCASSRSSTPPVRPSTQNQHRGHRRRKPIQLEQGGKSL